MLSAASIADAVRSVHSSTFILPVGNRTKGSLASDSPSAVEIPLGELAGIVAYDPSEFLITARGGTSIAELSDTLEQHGQYLPFDPLFASQGATLGGTLASGISGPGQMLYGSLRDFVMEVEIVDGLGQLVRGGGRVVKNAAGFDLPKLVVGSYGRLGVITEATLKVFPRPQGTATWTIAVPDAGSAIAAVQRVLSQPLPVTALDIELDDARQWQLLVRIAGPKNSLAGVLQRLAASGGESQGTSYTDDDETQQWREREGWYQLPTTGPAGVLLRVATSLDKLSELLPAVANLAGCQSRVIGGGHTTWIKLAREDDLQLIDQVLSEQQLPGIVVHGAVRTLRPLGKTDWLGLARRIQTAIDPQQRFARF